MWLVLGTRRRKQRPAPVGPIVIVDGHARLNIVDGRASRQRPRPPAPLRGRFPKPKACEVCGAVFTAPSGGSAYCSKSCQHLRIAERRVAEEIATARRQGGRSR